MSIPFEEQLVVWAELADSPELGVLLNLQSSTQRPFAIQSPSPANPNSTLVWTTQTTWTKQARYSRLDVGCKPGPCIPWASVTAVASGTCGKAETTPDIYRGRLRIAFRALTSSMTSNNKCFTKASAASSSWSWRDRPGGTLVESWKSTPRLPHLPRVSPRPQPQHHTASPELSEKCRMKTPCSENIYSLMM